MKKLILVRHGKDREDFHLSNQGRESITRLGEKLIPLIDGGTVTLISSTAFRAAESAEVLGQLLNVPFQLQELLYLEFPNCPKVLELIHAHQTSDVVILVTHLELVQIFPTFFAKEEWGSRIASRSIPWATAWVLDCEAQTLTHLE